MSNNVEKYYIASATLQSWDYLVDALKQSKCAWADYEGFHIGLCPKYAPVTSHLWAWDNDGFPLYRCRIDGDLIIVSQLVQQGKDDTFVGPNLFSNIRAVEVRKAELVSWDIDDKRVSSPLNMDALDWNIDLYEVLLPAPINFYRLY